MHSPKSRPDLFLILINLQLKLCNFFWLFVNKLQLIVLDFSQHLLPHPHGSSKIRGLVVQFHEDLESVHIVGLPEFVVQGQDQAVDIFAAQGVCVDGQHVIQHHCVHATHFLYLLQQFPRICYH